MRREKHLSVLLLTLSLLVLASCGVGSSKNSGPAQYVQPSQTDSIPSATSRGAYSVPTYPSSQTKPQKQSDIQYAAKKGKLFCPFSDQCHPALALVSVVTEQGLERCSGFLISDTEIMTNDHCVNKSKILRGWETRFTQLPCRDFVYVHFAAKDANSEPLTMACESIEIRSGEAGIISTDYSIIKLKGKVTDREPVKIAKAGFNNQDLARIYRVQMTNDGTQEGFNGIQTTLDCQASYATFLYPALNSAKSSVMTFGDCPIQKGNSGSPIFNERGEVAAIVQGYLTYQGSEQAMIPSEFNQYSLDPYSESISPYGEVSIGTSIPCIPKINPDYSKDCILPVTYGSSNPVEFLKNSAALDSKVLPEIRASEEWRRLPEENHFHANFITVPRCSSAPTFNSVLMTYKKGLNRFLQAEWRAQTTMNEKVYPFSQVSVDQYSNQSLGLVTVSSCSTLSLNR